MASDMRIRAVFCTLGLLAGCASPGAPGGATAAVPDAATLRPRPRAEAAAPVPPAGAATEVEFDTTTAAERTAATLVPDAGGERELGRTIAGLGDPADPGFWAKTPLVRQVRQGRLLDPATGRSVLVELRPLDAAPGAGSQVSLPALRLLDLPLTALPELVVYAVGPPDA